MEKVLDGKVAVVTGASRGIGKAIASWYARAGASVVCASRTTDAAPSKLPGTIDQTVREIQAQGGRAIAVACDVRLEEDVEALRSRTLEEFGRCDILVNNAGISFFGDALDLSPKRFDLIFDVNVRGPYLTSKAFAPHIAEQGGGLILNISSGAATGMPTGLLVYGASKAALDKLTQGLAIELQPHHINCISLGLDVGVLTEGLAVVYAHMDVSDWESPEIMGEAALWLANRANAYNGQVVTIKQLRADYAEAGTLTST